MKANVSAIARTLVLSAFAVVSAQGMAQNDPQPTQPPTPTTPTPPTPPAPTTPTTPPTPPAPTAPPAAKPPLPEQAVAHGRRFNDLDSDRSGTLSQEELDRLDDDTIMFADIDQDSDDSISRLEWNTRDLEEEEEIEEGE